MRIACPACDAAYQVPDDQLSPGRVVRCARCGTDWAPVVALPEPEPMPTTIPVPEPAVDPVPTPVVEPQRMAIEEDVPLPRPVAPAPLPKARALPTLAIAWAVSLIVVIGALIALVVGRDRVMASWPPSTRAYVALGLTPRP